MHNAITSHRLPALTSFFGESFLLHLLWENLQAPLFAGFESYGQHFWICFKAAWGDLLFMFVIYAGLAIVHRNPFWLTDRAAYAHPATWIAVLLIGIVLSVGCELWAVYVDHRWQYTEAMPLIPVLQIGLTPVLQMILIPLAVVSFSSRFSRLP